MRQCEVCGNKTESVCEYCSNPICDEHNSIESHECGNIKVRSTTNINNTEVSIDDSKVGTINIGDKVNDGKVPADTNEIKTNIESTGNDKSDHKNKLIKSLELASEIKANIEKESLNRKELIREIDRLTSIIDQIDNVSGEELKTISDIQKVVNEGQRISLSREERRKVRNSIEILEDELHGCIS